MHDAIDPTSAEFAALPGWDGRDGDARKAGFELEFAGLTQVEAAKAARAVIGGEIETRAAGDILLAGSDLGDLDIYLDTELRKKASGAIAEAGLDLGRAVVPVEVVTPPLEQKDFARLDRMREALRLAGATGTGRGVLLGFGLHLNPELADKGGADIAGTGAAYALMEDWLRDTSGLDLSRRVLPFTQRYPESWLDWISGEGSAAEPGHFAEAYLRHNPSRNHGLDLLAAIRSIWPDKFETAKISGGSVSARPAYHVRSPDCRIDEADWSVAREWNRWVLVERVARDADLMDALRSAWGRRGGMAKRLGSDWIETVDGLLRGSGMDMELAQ